MLLGCTILALGVANSIHGPAWGDFWRRDLGGLTLQHWVNDGLMAIFFLLVGLELERELYVGELSDLRSALLPIVAAFGGVTLPAAIHFAFNAGTPFQPGAGIPMATDIAFAVAALAVLGTRAPASLKVFLVAIAVIDDLIAIIVIAAAYTASLSSIHLLGAGTVFGVLVVLNRLAVTALWPYLVGGSLLWLLTLKSGIHATIAGVLLAFAIPFRSGGAQSPSARLEHALHRPVAFVVLPLFALANTGVAISFADSFLDANSVGIMVGLVVGKPVGIVAASLLAVMLLGLTRPAELSWGHIAGAGMLAGIGFTMSIFIANLAFPNDAAVVDSAKLAVLVASVVSAVAGIAWLRIQPRHEES